MHSIEYVLPTTFTRTVTATFDVFMLQANLVQHLHSKFHEFRVLVLVDWQSVSFVGLFLKSLHSEKCTSENYSMSISMNMCECVGVFIDFRGWALQSLNTFTCI